MTICNMSIEGGARAGLIAPDETTFDYIKGRPTAPKGGAWEMAHALLGDALFRRGRAFRPRGRARRRASCRRWSPGAPAPSTWSPITGRVPDPAEIADATSARAANARSTIWACRPARRSPTSPSTACSSAPAPMAASRICARSRKIVEGKHGRRRRQRHGRAGLGPGEGAGRGRGARQDLHGRRLRMARAGLLDVPRHEPRPARSPASAAPRPRTAISRAARAGAAAPIWCRRRWPPPPRSPAASSTSASSTRLQPAAEHAGSDHRQPQAAMAGWFRLASPRRAARAIMAR